MLILTRRTQESLMVGDKVTVTVLAVKGNQVRIGVSAPKEIPVHRSEIYERIRSGAPAPAAPVRALFAPAPAGGATPHAHEATSSNPSAEVPLQGG